MDAAVARNDFTYSFFNPLWVALGDNLGGIMDYYMETATPSLTMVSYVLWIFLSNIVLVGTSDWS